MTVEFGENGHFAANLAPETMSIEFFFFLTGSSDVNSDSSDAHSREVRLIRLPSDSIADRGHISLIIIRYYAICTDK